MPKRNPVKRKPQRMIIEFIPKRKRRIVGVGAPCLFCGINSIGKVYAEGGITIEGGPGKRNKNLWRYKGVIHEACAEKAREEKKRELGIS